LKAGKQKETKKRKASFGSSAAAKNPKIDEDFTKRFIGAMKAMIADDKWRAPVSLSTSDMLLDLDSGAGKSLIGTSTAARAGLDTFYSNSVVDIKGFSGESISTNVHTTIGTMDAFVSPELAADLVSVNPLVDCGLTVTLDKSGRQMHPSTPYWFAMDCMAARRWKNN
jgi:hypothetical protein